MQQRHPKRSATLVYTTFVRVSPELRKQMDREMRKRRIETYSDFVRTVLTEHFDTQKQTQTKDA